MQYGMQHIFSFRKAPQQTEFRYEWKQQVLLWTWKYLVWKIEEKAAKLLMVTLSYCSTRYLLYGPRQWYKTTVIFSHSYMFSIRFLKRELRFLNLNKNVNFTFLFRFYIVKLQQYFKVGKTIPGGVAGKKTGISD